MITVVNLSQQDKEIYESFNCRPQLASLALWSLGSITFGLKNFVKFAFVCLFAEDANGKSNRLVRIGKRAWPTWNSTQDKRPNITTSLYKGVR